MMMKWKTKRTWKSNVSKVDFLLPNPQKIITFLKSYALHFICPWNIDLAEIFKIKRFGCWPQSQQRSFKFCYRSPFF